MFTSNLRKLHCIFKASTDSIYFNASLCLFPIDETVKMVAIFIATMPSSTTGTILTIKYKGIPYWLLRY